MVVLNKIYTKTGDAETALGNRSRVAKHSLRVTAYGTQTLNATVGMARLDAEGELNADFCR